MVGYHCHLFLCVAVAECNRTYCTVLDTQCWIQMVGVSVACSSMELVPSVDLLYSGGYRWWGVSVACSSMELVPSVDLLYSGGYRWWVSVSPVPLLSWCRL